MQFFLKGTQIVSHSSLRKATLYTFRLEKATLLPLGGRNHGKHRKNLRTRMARIKRIIYCLADSADSTERIKGTQISRKTQIYL